jgi:hypothetical protein
MSPHVLIGVWEIISFGTDLSCVKVISSNSLIGSRGGRGPGHDRRDEDCDEAGGRWRKAARRAVAAANQIEDIERRRRHGKPTSR